MKDRTRVNFHCHSDLSDGAFPPEKVAALLAREGVRYAALTDHDTVAGLDRFSGVLERGGVGVISGVEITTVYGDREVHVLGYGFDPENDALRSALRTIRRMRNFGFHSALVALRESLQRDTAPSPDYTLDVSKAPFTCAEVIALIHGAGGRAFLAHPLQLASDPEELERHLGDLKELGLDGIEAYYAPYTPEQRTALAEMAQRLNLLAAAGTDFHRLDEPVCDQPGIDVPTRAWKDFRNALNGMHEPDDARKPAARTRDQGSPHRYWLRWRRFILRIILPVILTVVLFVITLFAVLLPATERALMARKREMSEELTHVVVSLLDEYEREAAEGLLTREEAQTMAAGRLRGMRYGPDNKDYFWATDTTPTMIFHPYRPELEGKDLSTFEDAAGKKLFVEFVEIVEKDGQGFDQYLWQWKDDPQRIEPKLSYVRLFEPWGWIVGTGMYLGDVRTEIHHLTNRLVAISVVITIVVALLLAFTAQQSLVLERRRRRTEEALHTSHEKFRTLVEAAAEGTMMVLDGQCAYANHTLLDRLGYAEEELALLDLYDILPHAKSEDNDTVRYFTDLLEGKPCPPEFHGQLRQRSGTHIDAYLSVRHISLGERRGFVISVRNTSAELPAVANGDASAAPAPWLVQDLHASVMFLNESIAPFLREPVTCALETPVRDAARLMSESDMSAVLVTTASGEPAGIVTDGDLRDRVLAAGSDATRPVFEIMSSPIVQLDEQALVYEAVLRMQERQLRHLVVRDATGAVVGMVRREDLLQFHRYASAVVTREIQRAEDPEGIARAHARLPVIVQALLESGTRPQSVMRFISSVHDAATARLLRLAIDKCGPPPARFAFICMGSQGRQEETLVTDQDNGIVYEDLDEPDASKAREYFEALGKQICTWLDAVGYDYCVGGIMAQNPLWRGPLSKWRKQLGEWIGASEPGDILKFDMFFDFRCVYGATDIAHALRTSVFDQVKKHNAFLMHFARNAIRYKPPLGWFGQIRTRSSGEEAPTIDLKETMMPIVEFARIYAIREHLVEANTLARLHRITQMGLLSDDGYEETVVAYEFLMRLRLREQAAAIAAGEKPGNDLAPESLTQIEVKTLREAFSQITTIQKHLSYDFLGVDET